MTTAAVIAFMYFFSPAYRSSQIKLVEPVAVRRSTITDYINLKGAVVELDRRELYPRCPSKVKEIFVSQGQSVSKGDVLMTLEASPDSMTVPVFYSEIKERMKSFDVPVGDGIYSSPGAIEEGEIYWIISPIDGVVMDIYSGVGAGLSGVFPCIAVSDLNKLGIEGEISELNVRKVASGMKCKITLSSAEGESWQGTVEGIAPYGASSMSLVDQNTEVRTSVSISIEGSLSGLKPGYTANVKITTGQEADQIVLPYDCIGQDDVGEYVMAVSGGAVHKNYITGGKELSDGMVITSGLTEGQRVARTPDKYSDGEQVRER